MPHVELPQAEFKVAVLGDTNTGKTSLVLRFVEGYYRDGGRASTQGAFFLTKRLTVQQMTTCKLLLWDTSGQARFEMLQKTYYQQAAAAIFTYDVSQPQSLHRLRMILEEVLQNTAGRQMIIAIAACKTDLDPSLHHPGLEAEAQQLAVSHGALYVSTSAKTNEGVHQLFEQTALRVWEAHKDPTGLPIPVTVGGNISSKHQDHQPQQQHQQHPVAPSSSRPASTRMDTPPPPSKLNLTPSNSRAPPPLKTIDSSADENSDDVNDEGSHKKSVNRVMCEGSMLACTEVPEKGCVVM